MQKGDGTGLRALVACIALSLAAVAQASPGNGVRMGGSSARLHPYLELESRYDSNVAYSDQGKAQPGFVYHVRPGFSLDTLSDLAALKLDANADWAQYTGSNSDLSRLYGVADLGVGLNRRGEIGLELTDSFRRSSRTDVLTLGGAVLSDVNDLQLSLPWRPGGGAFVTTVSGGWSLETFEPFQTGGRLCAADIPQCDPSQLSHLNYSDYSGSLELRWRFLPKTAVIVSGEYWKRKPSDPVIGVEGSGYRGKGGLQGLFTAHLAGTLLGGYTSTTVNPSKISTWYGNVEAEWIPVETTSVKLGYVHDTGADPGMGGGYSGHHGYFSAHMLVGGRFTPQLTADYEHREYPDGVNVTAADLLTASPTIEAELVRWLRVGGGVAYTKRTSKLAPGAPQLPGFSFDKTEVFVRLRGTY